MTPPSTRPSAGESRIAWATGQMPVLRSLRERFAAGRPLDGVRIAACLHVTAETAAFMRTLAAGGAEVTLCSANPLSTQDEVADALATAGIVVRGRRGESLDEHAEAIVETVAWGPHVTLDDGADLLTVAHATGRTADLRGGVEETTTGLLRLRAMEAEGRLACPVLAVNESRAERAFNDRHGTGQSALDGILRATNLLLAGHTVVVVGFGWTGRGVAQRARGAGASVVVCEVDPFRALEARMEGFEVMPALEAAERGDVFITVTGSRDVLRREHFERMKDGAVLANAGHFDVEISLSDLRALAISAEEMRPLVEGYVLPSGRRLHLLAGGRVVNLAAAEGHPATVMDISFALQALAVVDLVSSSRPPGVHPLPPEADAEVARLKLGALGVAIDEPTAEQRAYRTSWTAVEPL